MHFKAFFLTTTAFVLLKCMNESVKCNFHKIVTLNIHIHVPKESKRQALHSVRLKQIYANHGVSVVIKAGTLMHLF